MEEKTEQLSPLLRKNFLVQWGVLCLAFLTIAGTMIYYFVGEYNVIQHREGERLLTMIRVIDKHLNRQLDTLYQVMVGILDTLPREEDNPDWQSSLPYHFKQLRRAIPGVQKLIITNASGIITVSDQAERIGQPFEPYSHLDHVMHQTDPHLLYVSPPFPTEESGYAINLMLRLPSSDEGFTGVISATLTHDFFTILPASVLYSPDMWTAIAHGDGIQLMMFPYRKDMAGMNLAQPGSFFSRHRDSGQPENLFTGITYSTGEERIMALHTIQPDSVPMDKPLIVAAGRNLSNIHAEWRKEAKTEGAVFLLVSVLTSIGLFFFQRREWALNRNMAEVSASLKISEDRYRSILQTTMDGFFVMDLEGAVQEANESFCAMSGYDPHEILSLNLADLETNVDKTKIADCIQDVVKLGKNRFESRHRRKDGTVFDVEVSVQHSSVDGGRIISFIRDITRRKSTEEALKESEIFSREIQNIARLGGWKANPHTRFLKWTYGVYTILELPFEYEPSLSEGLTFYLPKYIPLLQKNIIECMETGEPFTIECQVKTSRGEILWVEVKGLTPVAERERTAIIGTLQDITQRKNAEEALRASEERFSLAFRTAPYALAITHAKNGKFLEFNDTFEYTTGYDREELLDATSLSLRLWVDESARAHVIEELQNGKKIVGEEHRFRKKNGDIVIGLFSAAMIMLDNEWCILSSIGDITEIRSIEAEREKLQAQFIQAQKMESVGRLAGGVAHDFNNMLSIIHGYAGMAMDELDPESPIYADLEEVRKAADRSANLTRQLLAFARRQTAAPIVLDVNETVEGMIKMLKRLIGENIDLSWKPGREVWAVKIDPSQIDQILANLCVNARDAIDGVGKITISTENAVFDDADCADRPEFVPGEYALIIVEDNGCGMDRETLDNIFEPFYTTKAVGEGTGLGLATVYGIVRQNYGFINVYSEPGIGTTFRIYLPRHHFETDPVFNPEAKDSATTGHETILLVEDDPSVLQMTAKMLERLGYTVLTANTPGKAIQLSKEYAGKIHLLMTDVIMPGMNGLELSKEILTTCSNLKLLFVSGYTADIIARHGVLKEGLHFIEKPLSKKVLADKLREVFDQRG